MKRIVPASLLVLSTLALLGGAVAQRAAAASPTVVVSQVFAGGGNSGAPYSNDFVELLNRGSTAVDLGTWSVQYATATGTAWQATALGGTVAPGHYYLVQLGTTATTGAALPLPDAVGTTNLGVAGGKIAIVHDVNPLTCGASAGSCSAVAAVADLIGYGSATDFEGAAAPALSATTAAVRAGAGCTDTDANAADFTAAAPTPRNTASAPRACSATTPAGPTQQAAVDVDVQPVLSLSLERSSLSFGPVATGSRPASLGERVTVFSNRSSGYSLSVHRSAFTPSDLPLGLGASAPTGAQLNPALAGGAVAPVPVAPAADLLIGTTSTASPAAGDVWPASVGFAGALPAVAPGHYSATITFTVIGR